MIFPWIVTQKQGALTTSFTSASANRGTRGSAGQVWKKVFDKTNSGVRCVNVGTASGSFGATEDYPQVMRNVYDSDNTAIRIVPVFS